MLALLRLPQQTRRLCLPSQIQNPARLTKLAVSAHWSRIIVFFFGVNARGSDSSVGHRVECARTAATWSRFGLELDWIICPEPLTGSGERLSCPGLFSLPLARSDVSTRILCRLFQMRTSALSEDSASCACRVARPQPRRSSVGQQSDGQYHSPAGRDGLPQVSPHASFFLDALCSLSTASLKLRAAEMTPSAWGRSRNITEVLSAPPHTHPPHYRQWGWKRGWISGD